MHERDRPDMRRIAVGSAVVAVGIVISLVVPRFLAPPDAAPRGPSTAQPRLETAPIGDMERYRREKEAGRAKPASGVAFEQRLGARAPLATRLVDERGRGVALGDEIDGTRPTVLVMGYLTCRDLCPMTFTGVDEALRHANLPMRDYRALFVSLDPREAARVGQHKEERVGAQTRDAWTFLGGEPGAIRAIANAVGFRFRYDADRDAFAHPAGFVVLTPQGLVSRYFFGVRFDPAEVALAIHDAARGVAGAPASPLLMLCYHFDPETGRYSLAILDILRAVAAAFLLALAGWAWGRR